MRPLTYSILLGGLQLAASCTRTYHDVVPGVGTVITRESYPAPEAVRTKKDLKLPAALRASLAEYRQRHGYWPHTTRALELDSDDGRKALWNMHRQGYELTELLCRHPDTLAVEFIFGTETKWHLDRDDDGIGLGRDLRGRFLFVADSTGSIQVWKTLDNTWRPGRTELVSQRKQGPAHSCQKRSACKARLLNAQGVAWRAT